MDINALHFADIPADLPANRKGSRIARFCDALDIGRATAIGMLVLLYHYTPHHIDSGTRHCDDGWAFDVRHVCLIGMLADWGGDGDRFLAALEVSGFGKRVGEEFILYSPAFTTGIPAEGWR